MAFVSKYQCGWFPSTSRSCPWCIDASCPWSSEPVQRCWPTPTASYQWRGNHRRTSSLTPGPQGPAVTHTITAYFNLGQTTPSSSRLATVLDREKIQELFEDFQLTFPDLFWWCFPKDGDFRQQFYIHFFTGTKQHGRLLQGTANYIIVTSEMNLSSELRT